MAEKATKKILWSVVFPDRTYAPGDEDDLEKRLTADQYDRLKNQTPPALEGEWDPSGEGGVTVSHARPPSVGRAAGSLYTAAATFSCAAHGDI